MTNPVRHQDPRRELLYEVIFEADTPAGKAFDILLLISITASVLIVLLDSVASIHAVYGSYLKTAEWIFTALFTLEYGLRIYCARKARGYIFSFYGIVDLLAVLPTYFEILFRGSHYLIVIRVLRVLRIFRVLKVAQYMGESSMLLAALRGSRRKISIFLFFVMTLVIILGSLMYLIEGPEHGFTSIPVGIYWAIVTLTTVGYGDISPQTPAGQLLASFIMLLGYAIIAVPTGIVSVEMHKADFSSREEKSGVKRYCSDCHKVDWDPDARFCKYCGAELEIHGST